jgi:hypothetical protein
MDGDVETKNLSRCCDELGGLWIFIFGWLSNNRAGLTGRLVSPIIMVRQTTIIRAHAASQT